ncbi:glycosyltransferase [Oxalobacter aliiformigenes]|uniref:Glycosyl transferase family 1 domain-containing protein n=2 Tax=Oxalobacter aliiformigenes TaxID=2946593 RepID=A0ABY7JFU2_9BURK|nr:glycosyltransferase [Oxalobacter aliiformigenes]WAV96504.1 hypothetical protein NB645_06610 [Oxalobacter aliiformigenes]
MLSSLQKNLLLDIHEYTLWLPEEENGLMRDTSGLNVRFYLSRSCAEILADIIEKAAQDRGKLYIFDNRTLLYPSAFSHLSDAFDLDPLTIAAVPCSNCNGVGTLSGLNDFSYEEFGTVAAALKKHLRTRIYVPVLLASCVCIKPDFFVESGIVKFLRLLKQLSLDGIVEVLYQKANDYGFNAVIVNDAFVYRKCKDDQSEVDRIVDSLLPWLPNFGKTVGQWLRSEEYRSGKIISGLVAGKGKCSVLLDFSNFTAMYNGTSIAGIQFLKQAVRTWPDRYIFHVMISEEAFSFLRLDTLPKVIRIDGDSGDSIYAACIRFGQPFSWDSVGRILDKAPVLGVFMYDCISADSNYLSEGFDRKIWQYIFQFSDVIYCISEFTKNRIAERFRCGEHTRFRVTRLSMDIHDYGSICDEKEDFIFVIGNNFRHKFVQETAREIAKALPGQKILVCADMDEKDDSVRSVSSGFVSQEEFDGIYKRAKCIVYPSLYEGFGLPIFQAIGSGTILYLRDSELNRELYPFIQYHCNVVLYRDTKDLIEKLNNGIPKFQKKENYYSENGGTVRFVKEVLDYLEDAMADANQDRVIERLLWFPADKLKVKYGKFKYWKYNILKKITFGKRKQYYNEKFLKLRSAMKISG